MSLTPTATQAPLNARGAAIRPDAVIGPDTDQYAADEAWKALDPCPVCGMRPHDAPEGTHFSGDPHYVFEHCWKCGYRPAINNAVSRDEMQRQFEAFQEFIRNGIGNHPTLEPPDTNQIAQMQAQIQELQDQLAARNAPAPVNTAPAESFTPATQPNIPDPAPIQQPPNIPQPGPVDQGEAKPGGNG